MHGVSHKNEGVRLGLQDSLDFICLAALTLGLLVLLLAWPDAFPPLRIGLSLVFLLLAPGYALTALLFPGRDAIDYAERLALTLGLSVAAVPLVGLGLNYTSWGIRLLPMTLGLTGFTFAILLAAGLRRRRLAPRTRFFSRYNAASLKRQLLLLGIVMLAGTVVVVTAQALRPPRTATEFYLLGAGKRLENFPNVLRPGEPFSVTLGILNVAKRREAYRIHAPFAGGGADVTTPELEPGELWQQEVAFRAPQGREQRQLSFELYRQGDAKPYRTLHFYVTLSPTNQEKVVMCPGGQPC